MMRLIANRQHPRRWRRDRRGAVLVAALVCMLVVTAMLGQMLLRTLRTTRQLRMERDARQCELLLQAGMARATFRLSQDSEYAGETWRISSDELIGNGAGEVAIEVRRSGNDIASQVSVVAEYPVGSQQSVRRSHSAAINLSSSSIEEN